MHRCCLLVLLGAACVYAQDTFELAYEVECLGNARSVEVVSPGADNSGRAARLTSALGDWARFNWPFFSAVPTATTLQLSLRRNSAEPYAAYVRVLRADGVEWQSTKSVPLEETWRTLRLSASDFKVFRGASADTAGALSLSQVVQIQLVPLSKRKEGTGAMDVDEIRLLPDGPAFTHDNSELRRVVTDPQELEFARLNDLRQRWSLEIAALQDKREHALRWKTALTDVMAAAGTGNTAEALRRITRHESAWLSTPQPKTASPLAPLKRAEFDAQLAAFNTAQAQPLIDFSNKPKVRSHTLYQAPKPSAVEIAEREGEAVLRQRIVFSSEPTRQVVFVTVDLPEDVNVEGRRIFATMRCTARQLNERQPLVMRLVTRNAEGLESWAQFKPQATPSDAWQEATFPLDSSVQGVRFVPQAVRQIAFRIENVPGQADDFTLEIGPLKLGWPEPLTRLREAELRKIDNRVHTARTTLFSERTAIAKLENALRCCPDAWAAYWRGFETNAPSGASARPSGGSTVLRQAVNRGWPDWSLRENGQGAFGRFTAYVLPEGYRVDDSLRHLLDDLWLDGVRHYGFHLDEKTLGSYAQHNISLLAGAAPSFRTLQGWSGMARFLTAYSNRCARVSVPTNPSPVAVLQVGNEVELAEWGADLHTAFPGAPYQPLDAAAESIKQQKLSDAPVMYVRAGRFTVIPPLPHEDICGINQYTGRYSGRMDEIERDLAELAIQSMFADRPLMITEWNGPKYSWASGGIGGVTTRGAAYYLERYWRGLIDTPGIVGSAEFTLNWVIAPFEDLTNQTREQAFANRFKHSRFSSLNSADHVPLLKPDQATQDECYGAMKAFHGPLYVMIQRPGSITIVYDSDRLETAEQLAVPLRALGKQVDCMKNALFASLRSTDLGHVVMFMPHGPTQTRIHPHFPDRLLVTVSETGRAHLLASAEELLSLRRKESAMGRVAAWIDTTRRHVYERYILEQAARGYLVAGNDTRTELSAADFYEPTGKRRAAWSDWRALILDSSRALRLEELELVKRVCAEGVNVVISRSCYQNNPGLQAWCGASLADAGRLTDRLAVRDTWSPRLLEVADMGSADERVIRRFAPKDAESAALGVSRLEHIGDAEVWCATESGAPVVAAWRRGKGRAVLFGCDFGRAAEVHWRVTHAGETHTLYDRDTACGLERVSRCVVNACLADSPPVERVLPRLYLRVVPDSVQVSGGLKAIVAADVLLCDSEGGPVSGELLARARMSADGTPAGNGTFTRIPQVEPGRFRLVCAPEKEGGGAHVRYTPVKSMGRMWTLVGLQLKAYAEGYVPTDGGAAFSVVE